nr:XRE family transcriptional regulator [Mesorhizobium sp. B2-3-14]
MRVRDATGAFRGALRREHRRRCLCAARLPEEDATDSETKLGSCRIPVQTNLVEVRTMDRQSFENVWDALEETPAESANMTMRSNLLIAIEQRVRSWDVTQAEAANRLGITQPRLSDLLRGRITNFSLDTLINLAALAGLTVRLDIVEAA